MANSIREYIHVRDAAKICHDILDSKYCNRNFILTGAQPIKVQNTIKMIAEILRKDKLVAKFEQNSDNSSHYEYTPYSYIPRVGEKFTLPVHIDFGQGIIQLIEDVKRDLTSNN